MKRRLSGKRIKSPSNDLNKLFFKVSHSKEVKKILDDMNRKIKKLQPIDKKPSAY